MKQSTSDLPPELHFSALLNNLKARKSEEFGQKKRHAEEDTEVYSEQTSLILLKRPSIGREEANNRSLNPDSGMKPGSIRRPKTSSVGIRNPANPKYRKSSTIQHKTPSVSKIRRGDKKTQDLGLAFSDLKPVEIDINREKKKREIQSQLPALHKRKEESSNLESIPPSEKERILAERIAAAENVMKELHKRNKALEEMGKRQSPSHEGCVARNVRLEEEVAHLRSEIAALKTPGVAPSPSSIPLKDEHSSFLLDREADTQHYLDKYKSLKTKICEFVAAFPSPDGTLLLKEAEVTETARFEYISRLKQVRPKQWAERNEILLEKNRALQQILESARRRL